MSLDNYTLDRTIARRVNPYIGLNTHDTQSNCIAAMEQIAFFVSDHEMQSVNGALMRMILAISAALAYESMPTHFGKEEKRDEGLIPRTAIRSDYPNSPNFAGVTAGISRAESQMRVGDSTRRLDDRNISPIA